MVGSLVRRLVAAGLLLLLGAGGGGLPVLDATLFHSLTGRTEPFRAHYEATSGCHADGCALRSTAQGSRFTAALPSTGLAIAVPERQAIRPAPQPLLIAAQPLRHFSRAPPTAS